jgi:hypothetical protein
VQKTNNNNQKEIQQSERSNENLENKSNSETSDSQGIPTQQPNEPLSENIQYDFPSNEQYGPDRKNTRVPYRSKKFK